ncbi:MAG: TOMM precursor leader peptide-binding protein, partial [Pseudomonadota bacterium]
TTNSFVVGPFIVPSETGCFDCERHRAMASALHPAEAEAVLEHGNGPSYEGGRVLDSMLRALAERHVNAILSGAWCLAAPGCVARHNPVTLETASSSILRLPRCPTCGSKDTRLPKRAIRDLT